MLTQIVSYFPFIMLLYFFVFFFLAVLGLQQVRDIDVMEMTK